ncbi:MAG: 23S rRNA (uridine2552-2'-O)-methyltransferase [Gammaproteobacteria bacterium]|nr:MAG: 23S rRNA (uridine2552-2'-O)-methyltransferase [Gammaproteobacteria bacterium]TND04777.1 MAG: 23S rRNA (uridine2552-2'-O)-methyltransferase [Gammaproteobacteria bacterium]
MQEHHDDVYVLRARQEGYRSRAAYKLLEINEKHRLLRPGMAIVDLGAAPGGWSQIAARHVGPGGRVIATDILPMEALQNVEFVLGDFTEETVYESLVAMLGERRAGLVISDMAPNSSGMKTVDQPRALYLAELALDMARRVLSPGGDFLVKVFQGAGSEQFIKEIRGAFGKVVIVKPKASRPKSREVYVLARNYLV